MDFIAGYVKNIVWRIPEINLVYLLMNQQKGSENPLWHLIWKLTSIIGAQNAELLNQVSVFQKEIDNKSC